MNSSDIKRKTEIVLFGGTTEGHRIVDVLGGAAYSHIHVTLCIATEYGGEIIGRHYDNVSIKCDRLDLSQIEELLMEIQPMLCIDATHPYAESVSSNIALACEHTETECIRVLRDKSAYDSAECIQVLNAKEAAAFLDSTEGNVLITTGTKELECFAGVRDFFDRCYVRVLPVPESIDKCHSLGIRADRIIAMQGPFSQKLNEALIKEINAKYLVSKESGRAGGFAEKWKAAEATGTSVVLIKRPSEKINQNTMFLDEVLEYLESKYSSDIQIEANNCDENMTHVTLVGIGPGSVSQMTVSALEIFINSDLIIGAGRMLDSVMVALKFLDDKQIDRNVNVSFKQIYKIEEIIKCIRGETNKKIAVVFSGDIGFSSGAMKLKSMLDEEGVSCCIESGISTLPLLCNTIGVPWEEALMLTLHGREFSARDIAGRIAARRYTGLLPRDAGSVRDICTELERLGLKDIDLYIGERLSYEDESVRRFRVSEIVQMPENQFDIGPLCAVVYVNDTPQVAMNMGTIGIRDEDFIREKNSRGHLIPMTKAEVRAVIMSKLALDETSHLWDIGAGTGSVSIRGAAVLKKGHVTAFEIDDEAAALFEKNTGRLGLMNIRLLKGDALENIAGIAAGSIREPWDRLPTHVFMGGTGGEMGRIVEAVLGLADNPVRFVASAVTLETLSEMSAVAQRFSAAEPEIVQLSVSRSRRLGGHNMMQAENPIYLISFRAGTDGAGREERG